MMPTECPSAFQQHASSPHRPRPAHLEALSALRRSISRSPSKRICASRSQQPSPSSPSSPSSRSPLRRVSYAGHESNKPMRAHDDQALLASPARKQRPSLRRTTPLRLMRPSDTPSRAPLRRALSTASDNGNTSSSSSSQQPTPDGQENELNPIDFQRNTFTTPLKFDKFDRIIDVNRQPPHTTGPPPLGLFAPPPPSSPRYLARQQPMAKSSPLKRSDGLMNLDQPGFGSPSSKRRSLIQRNSSESSRSSSDLSEDESDHDQDHDLPLMNEDTEGRLYKSPATPKFPSMRKMTPSRRAKKFVPSTARRSLEVPSARTPDFSSSPKQRWSLDGATPLSHPPSHTSIFKTTPADNQPTQYPRFIRQTPHPLSQALSPTSPTPSRPDDSMPTNDSDLFPSPEQPRINFSKSLPIGAVRPKPTDGPSHRTLFRQTPEDEPNFATPEAYKSVRPDPVAFMSTGLISKRHRDPDDLPAPPGGGMDMPDTPIKKNPTGFTFGLSPAGVKSIAKPRFAQPEFGTPSRPFNSLSSRPSSGTFGASIAPVERSDLLRRASFLSDDGSDHRPSRSPHEQTDSQSSNDEMPPTPTKHNTSTPAAKQHSLRSSILGRRPVVGPATFVPPSEEPLHATPRIQTSMFQTQSSVLDTPRAFVPETPLEQHDHSFPDPSNLSISAGRHEPKSPRLLTSLSNESFKAPETPSGHRDSPHFLGTHHLMMTPSHHSAPRDVDSSLTSRFKKVEWYGKGEFSEVFKVWQATESLSWYFAPVVGSQSSATPVPDKVSMVKKSKAPLTSALIRQRKLREVNVLRALGKHDHIVHLLDSWEASGHLYIQTEFCEEGSLDRFLTQVGQRDRLDDFRIWKILIELGLGIKHIHDSGFIHLDLKPENVFIDFEGVLKIGDFGLASEWPTPPNIEGEGDRRYIGPDLLQGCFDKPADIFALGIMIFEIACNILLPDNGSAWQKLRSGEFSGLPSLTSGSTMSFSADGPSDKMITSRSLDDVISRATSYGSLCEDGNIQHVPHSFIGNHSGLSPTQQVEPPAFMLDPDNMNSLDSLVQWMMSPDPSMRPTIDKVLNWTGCIWVNERRRAGAVVFEGPWGPPPPSQEESQHQADVDLEMMDVA